MQQTIYRAAAMLLAAVTVASCGGGEESREETWEVHSSEQECYSYMPTLCLQTRSSASSAWEFQYAGIRGFSYEMGYRYQVKVRITEVSPPPIDGSSEKTELIDVLAKTAVPRAETFDISVTEPSSITKVNDTTYQLFNRRTLTCTAENCMVIEAARTGGLGLLLRFDHQNSPVGPMHLLGITCTAPSATFRQTCLD
ncbi:DUF4377 domain-containing protein [Ideonella sp.]|uniref:DUF4377 domain-containing protein n=1 Tax=Ideonella sp. TaxID=1929293 RepID=UPI0035B41A92